MSNQGKFVDRNPGERCAGLVNSAPPESAMSVEQTRPSTPPHIARFRQSSNGDPGVKQVHYGVANDPRPPVCFTYGKKTFHSDHVNEILAPQQYNGLALYDCQLKEQHYAREKKEPLGQSMQRDYVYPAQVHGREFRFGAQSLVSENARILIAPPGGGGPEAPEVRALYSKSHGLTEAGEQVQRNYEWHVDKGKHRFGRPEPQQRDGVSMALQPESYANLYPATLIMNKAAENYRNTTHEFLGTSKNLGQGRPPVPEGYAYGANKRQVEWSAAQCIYGDPSPGELAPDSNLGKATRSGFRNIVKEGDQVRVFGVPTIRSDVSGKQQKSLADPNNYGDEALAVQLLYPDFWLRYGLGPSEFSEERSPEEIRELMDAAGVVLSAEKFLEFSALCSEVHGVLSLSSFIHVYTWHQSRGLS